MVSITEPRICDEIAAIAPTASAAIGRTTELSQPGKEVVICTYPVGLNHLRLMANTLTRKIAIRKPGIANPSTDTIWTSRSAAPRLRAAHTPSAVPTTAVTMVVPITSERVTATREVIAAITGWLVNQETPKSPRTALDSHPRKRGIR